MIMLFVRRYWREFVIGGMAIAIFALISRPAPAPLETTSERVVYKDRIVEKVVTVTKTVAVDKTRTITKPDGTKIVEETKSTSKEDIKDQSHQQDITRVDEKKSVTSSDPYRYSATASIKYNDPKAVVLDVGARLGGLPVSAVVGFDFTTHAARVGLRYDW